MKLMKIKLHATAFAAMLLCEAVAHAQTSSASSESYLPEIQVRATSGGTSGAAVSGYTVTRSAAATKTDTPLLETPQSISVISRERIEAQGAARVNDVIQYLPGVSTYGASTRSDWYTRVRGFDPSVYLDGLRLPYTINLASWMVDPFQLERVELVRGPSSVLFGQGDPGGVFNMVSKMPTQTPQREIQLQIGDHARKQVGVDVSGPIDDAGKFSYRLVALGHEGDITANPKTDSRTLLAPSFTWRPSADTTLTLQASYLKDNTDANDNFLPSAGTIDANPNGKISRNLFTGDAAWDKYEKTQSSLGYLFEHRFNDTWTVRQNLRYSNITLDNNMLYGSGFDSGSLTDINRWAGTLHMKFSRLAIDNQAQAKFATGSLQHTMLFGLDYQRQRTRDAENYVLGPNLNVFNPAYTPFDAAAFNRPDAYPSDVSQTQQQLGAYVQDQIKFNRRWMLTVGGRYDRSELRTRDLLAVSEQNQKDHAFSGRAGLTYLADSGLAPYVSYARAFTPLIGVDSAGAAFRPLTADQFEVGIKYQPVGSRNLFTAAIFDIRQKNGLTPDPADPTGARSIQAGEQRSRGLELEAVTKINRNLNVTASYTWQDVKFTRANDDTLGKTPTAIPTPKQLASVWADYRVPTEDFGRLGVGGGIRYTGKNPGGTLNTLSVPAGTVVDAAVYYDLPKWRLALNVGNLFDREYISGCYDETRCIFGAGRTVRLTARYVW
jgi:iron complex outermembrane recepter protein